MKTILILGLLASALVAAGFSFSSTSNPAAPAACKCGEGCCVDGCQCCTGGPCTCGPNCRCAAGKGCGTDEQKSCCTKVASETAPAAGMCAASCCGGK